MCVGLSTERQDLHHWCSGVYVTLIQAQRAALLGGIICALAGREFIYSSTAVGAASQPPEHLLGAGVRDMLECVRSAEPDGLLSGMNCLRPFKSRANTYCCTGFRAIKTKKLT